MQFSSYVIIVELIELYATLYNSQFKKYYALKKITVSWIHKYIGDSGASIIRRTMGILLASLAVSNVLFGITTYFNIFAQRVNNRYRLKPVIRYLEELIIKPEQI